MEQSFLFAYFDYRFSIFYRRRRLQRQGRFIMLSCLGTIATLAVYLWLSWAQNY